MPRPRPSPGRLGSVIVVWCRVDGTCQEFAPDRAWNGVHRGDRTHPKDRGRDRRSHPDRGPRGHIGWIVAGSLATGLVAALLLVAAPFIPAEEPAVTGAVLCGFA